MRRPVRFADLIRDDTTGHISPSKMWLNIGNLSMTVGFVKVVWAAQATEGLAWVFAVYGGLVAGSQFANRFLAQRTGAAPTNGTNGGTKT